MNNLVSGLQYNPSKMVALCPSAELFKPKISANALRFAAFYDDNKDIDVADIDPNLSIEEYLDLHKYSHEFRYEHLYPMCGALWSAPVEQVGQIPYRFVVSFFQHHRMLQLKSGRNGKRLNTVQQAIFVLFKRIANPLSGNLQK